MFRKYILILGIVGFSLPVFSQVSFKYNTKTYKIPHFKQDTLANFDSTQVLVKNGVLRSLKKSNAPFEIRVFYYSPTNQRTVVIKSDNQHISVERFETENIFGTSMQDTSYKIAGKIGNNLYLFVKRFPNIKLRYPETWDLFFQSLISNNFFDLPKEKAINDLILKTNPGFIDGPSDGAIYLEAKVAGYYRSVRYTNQYSPKATQIPVIQKLQNIQKLFYQFEK